MLCNSWLRTNNINSLYFRSSASICAVSIKYRKVEDIVINERMWCMNIQTADGTVFTWS